MINFFKKRKQEYASFNIIRYKCLECEKTIPVGVFSVYELKKGKYCNCDKTTVNRNKLDYIEKITYPI